MVQLTHGHVLQVFKRELSLEYLSLLRVLVATIQTLLLFVSARRLILRILEQINHLQVNVIDILFVLLEI